ATYAWTRVEDAENRGQQLKNIPEHVAQLGLAATLPARVDASVVWRWMHGRWLDDDGLFAMPDVSRVDLRVGRRFGPASLQLNVPLNPNDPNTFQKLSGRSIPVWQTWKQSWELFGQNPPTPWTSFADPQPPCSGGGEILVRSAKAGSYLDDVNQALSYPLID